MKAAYELYYWPSIQGRGEFIRLSLEDAGAPYVDVARLPEKKGGGVPAMLSLMRGKRAGAIPPFAPPFLRVGKLVIAQTTNILQFLAPRLRLVPAGEAARLAAHQLALTIADLVNEVHDVHHPISTGLYYEDQRAAAKKRAGHFLAERVPKFLGYFEALAERNRGYLLGAKRSYVDLSMFQVMLGLDYAFPRAMKKIGRKVPRLVALRERIAARPRIAAYLASSRRIPFNESGIFRHYPELDS